MTFLRNETQKKYMTHKWNSLNVLFKTTLILGRYWTQLRDTMNCLHTWQLNKEFFFFFLLKASNSFSPLSSLPIHLSLEATLCVLSHPYPSFSNESPFSLLKSPVPPPFPRAGEQGIFSGSRRNFASTRQGRWYRRFWTWILVRRLDGEWANLGFVSRERWEMRYN